SSPTTRRPAASRQAASRRTTRSSRPARRRAGRAQARAVMAPLALAAWMGPLSLLASFHSSSSTSSLGSFRGGLGAAALAAPALADARRQHVPALIVPGAAGAKAYAASARDAGVGAAPAVDPLRAAVMDDVRAQARRRGAAPPAGDSRLDLAMTDLARGLRGDDLPAVEVVDFLLSHYGVVEPSPNLLLERAAAGSDETIRRHVAEQVAEV